LGFFLAKYIFFYNCWHGTKILQFFYNKAPQVKLIWCTCSEGNEGIKKGQEREDSN
jgi:hypothetical protein